jgi:hypothetical protein
MRNEQGAGSAHFLCEQFMNFYSFMQPKSKIMSSYIMTGAPKGPSVQKRKRGFGYEKH